MRFTKRIPTSDARIWLSMKLKGLFMRLGNSFLFNSVHLWTVPLSFTLFMADYTHWAWGPSWSLFVHNEIKVLAHQRLLSEEAGYLLFDQLTVVIEGSRWQLLHLVVTQFLKKRYPLISVKVLLFRNCCYCKFLILFFLLD